MERECLQTAGDGVSWTDWQSAIPQNFRPWIHVTPSDFNALTRNRALCDENGNLSPQNFDLMMREQARGDIHHCVLAWQQ
jgi:hypothetical protein